MYRETFPMLLPSIKLSVTLNDGLVSLCAFEAKSLESVAYDSGFEVGHAHFAGSRHYITTGGGHFLVSRKTCDAVVAWLRKNGVKVNDYNIKGKKVTHVIVDEVHPVTATTADDARQYAADAAAMPTIKLADD